MKLFEILNKTKIDTNKLDMLIKFFDEASSPSAMIDFVHTLLANSYLRNKVKYPITGQTPAKVASLIVEVFVDFFELRNKKLNIIDQPADDFYDSSYTTDGKSANVVFNNFNGGKCIIYIYEDEIIKISR